ncbi:MAG TPA: energy transducer TonB [bacterium]
MTWAKGLSLAGLSIIFLSHLDCSLLIHKNEGYPIDKSKMPAPLELPRPEDMSYSDQFDESPVPISQEPPIYNYSYWPYEGTVRVKFLVNREGNVAYAKVYKSSGHTGLDNEALRAVMKWKFIPAKLKGEPVQCWMAAPVQFKLK